MKTRLLFAASLFIVAALSARAAVIIVNDDSGFFIFSGGTAMLNTAFGDPLLNTLTGTTIFPTAHPPFITAQPVSITTPVGHNVVFCVAVTGGTPLTYHWQKNGGNLKDGTRISGCHTSTLTVVNLQKCDAGNYRVVITNAAGAAVSRVAKLTVYCPPPPPATAKKHP